MALALPGRLVLFDYGEVISRPQSEPDRAALLAIAGVPGERFWPAYWAERDRLDHGRLSVRDYWSGIGRACGANWDDAWLQSLWAADLRSWISVDPEVLAVVAELSAGGTRLAVLSNAGFDYSLLRGSPLAGLVERIFLSAELRLLGPRRPVPPCRACGRAAVPDGESRTPRSTCGLPTSLEYRRSGSSSWTTRRATWRAPSRSA